MAAGAAANRNFFVRMQERRGFTVSYIADLLGIPIKEVNEIMKGVRLISQAHLSMLKLIDNLPWEKGELINGAEIVKKLKSGNIIEPPPKSTKPAQKPEIKPEIKPDKKEDLKPPQEEKKPIKESVIEKVPQEEAPLENEVRIIRAEDHVQVIITNVVHGQIPINGSLTITNRIIVKE